MLETIKKKHHTIYQIFKWIIVAFIILACLIAVFLVGLYFYHPKLLYLPKDYSQQNENNIVDSSNLPIEIEHIRSEDGQDIHAYWIPLCGRNCKDAPTVLYLHGNSGNLHQYFKSLNEWKRNNVNVKVLLPSYRGFGFSKGTPSQKGIKMDAQASIDFLVEKKKVSRNDMIIYGHSFGGAVATYLVQTNTLRIGKVILENTFQSVKKMVSHKYPLLNWATFVITETWDSESEYEKLGIKVKDGILPPKFMLISGYLDTTVPRKHMVSLNQTIGKAVGKKFVTFKNYPDCNHDCYNQNNFIENLIKFVENK